jgi:hypothetical protein
VDKKLSPLGMKMRRLNRPGSQIWCKENRSQLSGQKSWTLIFEPAPKNPDESKESRPYQHQTAWFWQLTV